MKKEQQKLYEEFLNPSYINNSKFISKAHYLKNKISSDLVQSKLKICFIYLFFSILGYFFSLFLCSNSNSNLTSYNILNLLNNSFLLSFCSGVIYTIVPFLFTLLFFNRFKRRYIYLKLSWLVIILPIFSTTTILLLNCHVRNSLDILTEHAIWVISANVTAYFFYIVFYYFIRQNMKKI